MKAIRINKKKKQKTTLKAKTSKGRNSEMGKTMNSFNNRSRSRKKKMPRLKLSFDLMNSINPVSTATSNFMSHENLSMYGSHLNIEPIFRNQSPLKQTSLNSHSLNSRDGGLLKTRYLTHSRERPRKQVKGCCDSVLAIHKCQKWLRQQYEMSTVADDRELSVNNNTVINFYKPQKPQIRPASGYMQKPPIYRHGIQRQL